jgi:hypothetical protein
LMFLISDHQRSSAVSSASIRPSTVRLITAAPEWVLARANTRWSRINKIPGSTNRRCSVAKTPDYGLKCKILRQL